MIQPQTPLTCRMTDAPKVFGISRDTLYRWCSKGPITIHKKGNVSLVLVEDVLAYIKRKPN